MDWILKGLSLITKLNPIGFFIKFILGSFGVMILPKVISYALLKWGDDAMSYALSKISSMTGMQYEGLIVDITGMGGYLAQKLRLVDCFTVIISTSITIFLLSFVRKS